MARLQAVAQQQQLWSPTPACTACLSLSLYVTARLLALLDLVALVTLFAEQPLSRLQVSLSSNSTSTRVSCQVSERQIC